MKVTKCTFGQLKDAGVSIDKLLETVQSAIAKREILKQGVTQGKQAFRTSESAKVARNALTDAEDFAMQVIAFDKAMQKACETWGTFEWALPKYIVENASKLFPHVSDPVPA